MGKKTVITVAHGDGIGPEIMDATLRILNASGAQLEYETVEIGEKVYLKGHKAGIEPSVWESLHRTKVFLKAPITTPQGGGFKSLNVTARTNLGLYANIRPCVSYHPYVSTKHPKMDVVIIRENEEDLYTGIEYQQTADTVQALKIITRPGCERIIRYAFEYAQKFNRKKVTCFSKDNILKLSDGLFHKIFDEIAKEYPHIENEHWIIDIGAAKLADTPEAFDVIVMANLYGDILSDVAAQIAGSVGLAGSANIGPNCAMFEAIHGSAPRRAGQNLANPSGLLLGAVMMLVHVGQPEAAEKIHNAWLKTMEDGIHTYDIFDEGVSSQKVGTKEFADAVIARMGKRPEKLPAVAYAKGDTNQISHKKGAIAASIGPKKLVGVDLFVDSKDDVHGLQAKLAKHQGKFELLMISNRGAKMWPDPLPEMNYTNQWRCRFKEKKGGIEINQGLIGELLQELAKAGIDVTKTENLYTFGGIAGYTMGSTE
jgi:isocitrate dehydrogenase